MKKIDIAQLTTLLGRPASDQSAVQAWTGTPYGTTWTPAEARELKDLWIKDQNSMVTDE